MPKLDGPAPNYDPVERLETGKRLNREGQYHDAIDALEDAILANYKTEQAYYELYVAYNALGRGIEAQEALNRSRPAAYQQGGQQGDQRACSKCGGRMVLETDYPNKGAGYIVLVLGIIFAAFCVGIIICIYAFKMIGEKKEQYHCTNCGAVFPV